ncbi:hypothetical protein BCR36DRAFT_406788 [Piromyces finnis]|uniref:Calponin-homology (CH) domain-containing protein n=1 Tax=Piromyces finnis TaxID=1754191 RepID=A0A1Y1UYE0_9FUNG|nr:hypothetical protein BCR36DRAFT_406788 [Piromyces finnis]|eukprot:ORX43434.1 hypothetical protein BCR36DRAFT_406788 [Piromyces finnis]
MDLGVKKTTVNKEYQLHASSKNDFNVKTLMRSLTAWINQTLQKQHLIVRDIVYDLSDGQILAAFIETLTYENLDDILPGSTEKNKISNINKCIQFAVDKLGLERDPQRWTAEGIVKRDISSILAFLVDLSHYAPCPLAIPSNVTIAITHQDKIGSGGVKNKTTLHSISGDETQYNDKAGAVDINYLDSGKEDTNEDEDVFDKMQENQDKIAEIKELLVNFCNNYLALMNVQINELEDFSNGVYILWLIGLIKNIFIPSYNYKENPSSYSEKLENVNFSIYLLNNLGINCSKIKPSDIVKGDAKSILRCLYILFSLNDLEENQQTS